MKWLLFRSLVLAVIVSCSFGVDTNPFDMFQPTSTPTLGPTATLTAEPTRSPTVVPTADPTRQPTAAPSTDLPSTVPTTHPSPSPTPSPSALPSAQPTPQPTVAPSPYPSSLPSPLPTAAPTFPAPSPRPTTSAPTQKPTPLPTVRPTASPSSIPTTTFAPSPVPTLFPSEEPSARPSYTVPASELEKGELVTVTVLLDGIGTVIMPPAMQRQRQRRRRLNDITASQFTTALAQTLELSLVLVTPLSFAATGPDQARVSAIVATGGSQVTFAYVQSRLSDPACMVVLSRALTDASQGPVQATLIDVQEGVVTLAPTAALTPEPSAPPTPTLLLDKTPALSPSLPPVNVVAAAAPSSSTGLGKTNLYIIIGSCAVGLILVSAGIYCAMRSHQRHEQQRQRQAEKDEAKANKRRSNPALSPLHQGQGQGQGGRDIELAAPTRLSLGVEVHEGSGTNPMYDNQFNRRVSLGGAN